MKTSRLFHLLVPLAAALLIIAPAQGAQPVTTSLQVPLAGTVDVPLSDGSLDPVALTGQVHVVTHVQTPPNPVRVQINLDQVSGVGEVTKLLYVATGANRINLPFQPTDPMNLGFDPRAVGIPPDSIQPQDSVMPLDISFVLTFNPDTGALAEVSIESMSVPVP